MDQKLVRTIYYLLMAIHIVLYFVQIGICIFICAEWRKAKSTYKSAYFIILISFYCLDLPCQVLWVYGRTINYNLNDPLLPLILISQWYKGYVIGIWEAVLGLTRCTAMAFPNLHNKLWDGKGLWFALLFIYLFPFIAGGYVWTQFECKFLSSSAPGCWDYRNETVITLAILIASLNFLCLAFILVGVILAPKGYHKSQKSKMERRLMIQTLSSALLAAICNGMLMVPFFSDTDYYLLASYFFGLLQYYPPMLYIFFVIPTIRSEFATFFFSWYRINDSNKIIVAHNSVTVFHTRV
uniref:Serpentine receptor class gamma n=1 Tax=Panagrolaimus sp. PS1159 TaxID=55785 RepID=A0AC35GJK5_9BILA